MGQPRNNGNIQLFPTRIGSFFADPNNPAFCAKSKSIRAGIRIQDPYLLPSLAHEEWQFLVPLKKGVAQLLFSHYGNSLYRELSVSIGYALPIGANSGIGFRMGPSRTRIGENHGKRDRWTGTIGIRARPSPRFRWEAWIKDLHATLHRPPLRELLHPTFAIGAAKRWPGKNSWAIHLRKELGHPLSFSSRSRIRLHERVGLITGIKGLPLSPILGWNWGGKSFFFRSSVSWDPPLGITPTLLLIYRYRP